MCIGTASMMTHSPPECVIRVQGTKGQVIVPIHGSRPEMIIVRYDERAWATELTNILFKDRLRCRARSERRKEV
ncbi:hypothetical protein V1517DRAFT_326826 [Lipomyces orientalis]|uniref:Uncharacterized protein n=1 Tax=Lipomyces orientalis TaxID=1233043 RepID=A0ACC3TK74_9ASCO